MHSTKTFFRQLLKEIYEVSYTLFKLMIPVIIVVKILEELGGIEILSSILAPLMHWVGLPETMGLVWATTILTNIYAGLLVFVTFNAETPLTVAQVSVLGGMMLIAHGLPVEAAIAKKAYKEGRPIKDVALEMTDLSEKDLDRLLDPAALTRGGIQE